MTQVITEETRSANILYTYKPSYISSKENTTVIREATIKSIEDLTKIRDGDIDEDLTKMDNIKLSDTLIKCYIDTIRYLLFTPTIVKLSSLNKDELLSLINNVIIVEEKDKKLNTQYILRFIYNFLYVDITTIIEPKLLDFLKNYEEDILNDSTNYKQYINSQTSYRYLYIKRFINVLNDITDLPESYKNDNFVKKMRLYIQMYILDYTYFIKAFKQLVNILDNDLNIIGLTNKLNEILENKTKNNILTYIKIRNKESDDYNKRFRISTDEKQKYMLLEYNDDNTPYYKRNDNGEIVVVDNEITSGHIDSLGHLQFDNYSQTYALGPFTKTFSQYKNNIDIASDMKDVINSLTNPNPKPVFIMGYGASGAGKTSSLIYLNKTKEDGVIIHLCNLMADNGYKKAEIKTHEFYTSNNKNVDITNPRSRDYIGFSYNSGSRDFKLDDTYEHVNTHADRVKLLHDLETDKKSWNLEDNITKFEKESKLGEILSHLIDKDRFVKATLNNPNSSRSHTLIFIKLINSDKKVANLIIGDFAGVENVLDCKDDTIIERLLNTKGDIDTKVPFYSKNTEFNYKPDSNCANEISSPDDVYVFSNDASIKNANTNPKIQQFISEGDSKSMFVDVSKYNNLQFKIVNKLLNNSQVYTEDNKVIYKTFKNNKLFENNKTNLDKFINILTKYTKLPNDKPIKDVIKILMQQVLPDRCIKSKERVSAGNKLRSIIENKLPDKDECDKDDQLNQSRTAKKQKEVKQTQIGPDDIVRAIIAFFNDNVKYLMMDPSIFNLTNDIKITNTETIYQQLLDIFNNFSPEYIEAIKHISNTLPIIFKEKECKQTYMTDVCAIRTNETSMINESLKDIRDIIRNILLEKNKASMDASPEFIDACLPSYCDGTSCFSYKDPLSTNKGISKKDINSVIFNTIKDELAQSGCNQYKCLNIIIGVFCVVNLEKLANNPPPTPYIDINNLRYQLNYMTKETFKDDSVFIKECSLLINKMETIYKDKISLLLTNDTFKNFKTMISSKLYKQKDINKTIQMIILLLNEIDKMNASSTIGTLQFVDTLSKYNTVEIMCTNVDVSYQPIEKVIKRYNFKNIVS